MLNKIKYTATNDNIQNNMKKDIAKIRKTNKVIKSEKTGNYYYINVYDFYKSICKEVNKI